MPKEKTKELSLREINIKFQNIFPRCCRTWSTVLTWATPPSPWSCTASGATESWRSSSSRETRSGRRAWTYRQCVIASMQLLRNPRLVNLPSKSKLLSIFSQFYSRKSDSKITNVCLSITRTPHTSKINHSPFLLSPPSLQPPSPPYSSPSSPSTSTPSSTTFYQASSSIWIRNFLASFGPNILEITFILF